ncbi:MAG: DUF2795 domain-containing protein [Solirubrobacteraceae bacterium]|jgi:hypothetical protein
MSTTQAEVRHALAAAVYPATPGELVNAAELRGGSTELLADLESLAGAGYDSVADVLDELGDELEVGGDDDEDVDEL